MLKVLISYIDKNGNQLCLLEEKETEFYYLVNLETMSVSYFGIMDSFYNLVENIDAEENIYVEDRMGFAHWLLDNYDDLDCDIHAIIDHLIQIEK